MMLCIGMAPNDWSSAMELMKQEGEGLRNDDDDDDDQAKKEGHNKHQPSNARMQTNSKEHLSDAVLTSSVRP